jgi:hypothetical protein
MLRIFSGTLFLLAFLSLSPVSEADTFDFSLVSVDGLYSGAGSFNAQFTAPYGYELTSLDAEINGDPLALIGGYLGADLAFDGIVEGPAFSPKFFLDGSEYLITEQDAGPIQGDVLVLIDSNGDYLAAPHEILFTVSDVSVKTPEPSVLLLLLFGFGVIGVGMRRRCNLKCPLALFPRYFAGLGTCWPLDRALGERRANSNRD